MHQRHAEALDRPHRVERHGERVFAVRADGDAGRRHKGHEHQRDEGDEQAAGDSPLAADLLGDAAGDRKADDRSQAAGDGKHHRGARCGVEVIDNVVADVCAYRVIGHEPQEFRAEYREQHTLVGLGHGLVVVDRGLDRGEALALGHLILHFFGDLVFLYREEQHQRRNDHQHRRDDERQLDYPDFSCLVSGVDIVAELKEDAKHRGERSAKVAHDVYDAVCLGAQGLGRDIRHERDRGITVHHHKYQHYRHHRDHTGNVVIVEEQRDKREGQRRDGSAGEDIGHALAYRRLCLIGKVAEYRQQDECGKVIAGHDYASHWTLRIFAGSPALSSAEDMPYILLAKMSVKKVGHQESYTCQSNRMPKKAKPIRNVLL